jgi:hypothetical protein
MKQSWILYWGLKPYFMYRMIKDYFYFMIKILNKTPWPDSASELYRESDHRLSTKLVPKFANIWCHVVSVTDPYCPILGFIYRSRHCFLQVAPQLHSRGLSGPRSRPTTSQKIWYRWESNLDLWICSQELSPLDHRGGLTLWSKIKISSLCALERKVRYVCKLYIRVASRHCVFCQFNYHVLTWRFMQVSFWKRSES